MGAWMCAVPQPRPSNEGTLSAARSLRLLGVFELQVQGRTAALPPKAQRVVAFLGVYGRTSRSQVAGSVWPRSTEGRALANLRTMLWKLTRSAPGVLISLGGTLGLRGDLPVDAHRLADEARALLVDGVEPDQRLLAELRGGADLLPDWDEPWLATPREQLRQLVLDVWETYATQLAARGRFGLALDAALTALRADPFRESAHRLIIGIHLGRGNVAAARRAHQECLSLFVREIGVEPSIDIDEVAAASWSLDEWMTEGRPSAAAEGQESRIGQLRKPPVGGTV